MKYEVKIILYPEIHKSKNGEFFERLMQSIFDIQGYNLTQNINFTGLEIDLFGKHKHRNETLLVECKAKKEPKSTEVKNFFFNILTAKMADHGYFLHTEELHHQAAGLVSIWKKKEESKNFTFLGPKEIIDILTDAGRIKPFEFDIPQTSNIEKLVLAYTYFGIFYIPIVNSGTSITTDFFIFNAATMQEVIDLNYYPNQEFAKGLTFEKIIKDQINSISSLSHKIKNDTAKPIESNYIEICPSFSKFLESPGPNYTHPQKENIKLDDIFVAPDLKELLLKDDKKKVRFPNLLEVAETITEDGFRYVLLGNESSGKTTICKYLYTHYYYEGFIPVLINGSELPSNIRSESFERFVIKTYNQQYKNSTEFKKLKKNKIIVIIDDFHNIKVKSNFRAVLVRNICAVFNNVIITGNTLMPLESIIKNKTSKDIFDKFFLYSILEFGHKLRYDIVNKWNTIGQDIKLIDTNTLLRKNDNAVKHVQSIIGKNYIPSYPFYILTILQALEGANSPNSSNYSQHGFYYELIINTTLNKSIKDKKEISLYINYITSFCYFLFEQRVNSLSIVNFEEFHSTYCERHDISYDAKKILNTFQNAKLLDINGRVSVSQKFIYYFFVAKYLTNNISKNHIKDIIGKMCKRLYIEEFGNIIMFLTHLSKDEFIIDELLINAKSIFDNVPIAKIEDDVQNINKLVKELPKQVLKHVDVNDMRSEELEDKDNTEKLEREYETDISNITEDYNLDDDVSAIDLISKLTLALKNVEILGQIAKKYWGEMTGVQKNEITNETYHLALRTLNTYLLYMEENSDVLVNQIAGMIDKKFLKDEFGLEKRVEDLASNFIFRLCFLSSFNVITRVSNAIGYDKLQGAFENVVKDSPYNSVKLIDLSIKLEHYSKFPLEQIKTLKKELMGNKLGFLVLRNLVVNYLYMFSSDYKLKSQLCDLLGIDMKSQYRIDRTSKIKKNK